MMSRREVLLSPLALLAKGAAASAASATAGRGTMTLAMHQNTCLGSDYRRSLEGWARAGIKQVELIASFLDDFLKTESLAAARRVLADLGLTAVSGSCGRLEGLWEPNPSRAAAVDTFKRRCQTYADLGLARIYATTATSSKFTLDDYRAGADNMREVGEVARQFGLVAMVEFVRTSTFISTLPTVLNMTRAAAHPNMRPMLDCYHFWSGLGRLEDLDLVRPGEIAHVHFQDVPDMPRELLDNATRVIPGDGIAPLTTILRKLSAKGYRGPLSVELFLPQFRDADPYEVARTIRPKAEAVMRRAGVA